MPVETLFIMVFGSKNSCLTARLGFIRYFLTCLLHISKHISHKNSHLKRKMSQGAGGGGGAKKGQKNVTYYLNGP